METETRMAVNAATALQGEAGHQLGGGHEMRRVSLESVSVLQLVGSPFAPVFNAALNGEAIAETPAATAVDIAVFAWAHSAPADDVLQVALTCSPGYAAPAVEAAMKFIRTWSVDEVGEVMRYVVADAQAVQAANFDMAAPSYGEKGGKKNS